MLALFTAIMNGDDLSLLIRRAFAVGRPEALLSSLQHVACSYDFKDRGDLSCPLPRFHVRRRGPQLPPRQCRHPEVIPIHVPTPSSSAPLLITLGSFLTTRSLSQNLSSALSTSCRCVRLLSSTARANSHLVAGPMHLFLALRVVGAINKDLSTDPTPLPLPNLGLDFEEDKKGEVAAGGGRRRRGGGGEEEADKWF